MSDWITPQQAAHILNCDPETFYGYKDLFTSMAPPGKRRCRYSRAEVKRTAELRTQLRINIRAAVKVMGALRDGILP